MALCYDYGPLRQEQVEHDQWFNLEAFFLWLSILSCQQDITWYSHCSSTLSTVILLLASSMQILLLLFGRVSMISSSQAMTQIFSLQQLLPHFNKMQSFCWAHFLFPFKLQRFFRIILQGSYNLPSKISMWIYHQLLIPPCGSVISLWHKLSMLVYHHPLKELHGCDPSSSTSKFPMFKPIVSLLGSVSR